MDGWMDGNGRELMKWVDEKWMMERWMDGWKVGNGRKLMG